MRNMKKRGNNQGQGINLNEAYNKLKALYAERCRIEQDQKRLWTQIKKYHCNKSSEMDAIDRRIGNATHKINQILSQLCQCRKAHKVMTFAYNYISSELVRAERIAKSWERKISDVENGYSRFIDAKGVHSTDTRESRDYLNKKRRQIAQLRKWQAHVAHYRA